MTNNTMLEALLVSVVITTKNEERHIANCIKSIQNQTWAQKEVIVVDNFSSDRTKEISLALGVRFFEKGPERSAQRNHGMIDQAQGQLVMFVDADMILSPRLLEEAVAAFQDPQVLALHLPEIILGKSFFSQVRRFERRFYDGTPIDGARIFRREAFEQVGGFDESMSGPEDWDIDKKIKNLGKIHLLKTKPVAQPEDFRSFILSFGVDPNLFGAVIYHNESEFNLKAYLKKKSYYAGSFDQYINKWGRQDQDIQRQFSPVYRFFGVFVEKGKFWSLLAHPLLSGGMYFLRFLVGVAFLTRKKQS